MPKGLPSKGIFGWDSDNETWVKVKVDSTGKVSITSTDLTTVLSEIQHATYGLSALKDLIDVVDGYHDVPTANATTNAQLRDVIGNKTDDPDWFVEDNQSLIGYAKAAAATGGGISYSGKCDAGMTGSTTTVVCDDLKGFGDDFFNSDYVMTIALNDNSHGNAPESNAPRDIQDYDSSTGTFTVAAFSANVEENDKIVVTKRVLHTMDKVALASSPTVNSLAYRLSQFIASGDGDFAGSTPLPSNKSLYDVIALDRLDNATYGLSAIETLVDRIESKTNNLPADPADASDIAADFDRHLTPLEFWGDPSALVTITGSSSDVNLPDVIIPTLPTGATIWKVQLIGYISLVRDTSASDNAINGVSAIRIKKSTGAWGTDDIVALDIPDNFLAVDVSTSADRSGVPLVGNLNNDNLSGEVDGAATYNLRFEDIAADGANLTLLDVQVGLRVWIY